MNYKKLSGPFDLELRSLNSCLPLGLYHWLVLIIKKQQLKSTCLD